MRKRKPPVISGELAPTYRQRRSLSEIPFEEAFSRSPDFLLALRDRAKSKIADHLGVAQDVVRTVSMRDGGGYELVLSPEAMRGLRSQRLKPYYDPKTKLLDPQLRTQQNKFAERGKLARQSGQSAARAIVAGAHVVADLDTQAKLQAIEAKLDALLCFVKAQRVGELRGLYNRLRLVLEEENPSEADVASIKTELHRLAGSFFETARTEFGAVKDPSQITFIEAAFSLQDSAEQALREQLLSAYADVKGWAFATFLLRLIATESDGREALAGVAQQQVEEARVLLPIAAEKWGYLDPKVQRLFSEQVALYDHVLPARSVVDVYLAVEPFEEAAHDENG